MKKNSFFVQGLVNTKDIILVSCQVVDSEDKLAHKQE